MDAAWLQGLVTTLNPQNQPGRLTLIHRFGAKDVEKCLPRMTEAVRQTGHQVLWVCDPMHGNTETDRKSTRLNSSHSQISYAVFCLKKKEITFIDRANGVLSVIAIIFNRLGCVRLHRS